MRNFGIIMDQIFSNTCKHGGILNPILPVLCPRGMKLTTNLDLVPRLRMRGFISALPQYVFIAW